MDRRRFGWEVYIAHNSDGAIVVDGTLCIPGNNLQFVATDANTLWFVSSRHLE